MENDISLMVGDVKFNFRVGCIMEYNDKIVIERNMVTNGCVLPGGRVKTEEDTKQALIREIKEEMHMDISNKEIELVHIIENFFGKEVRYHELYFVYKIKLNNDDEIVNLPKEALKNYDSDTNYYEFILKNDMESSEIKPNVLIDIVKNDKVGHTITRD